MHYAYSGKCSMLLSVHDWRPAIMFHICLHLGLCNVKTIPQIKKNLDRAHPTHPPTHPPPSTLFFPNPSLTWTEHSNHNNQQLLAMYSDRIHMVYYSKICRAILGRFSTHKQIPSETCIYPPTSIEISFFLIFLQSP